MEEEWKKLTSALEEGGDGGKAPKICWESSISLALSDLWTPARKPSGRLGGWMSAQATENVNNTGT